MTHFALDDVWVQRPVMDAPARSLKKTIIRSAVGGALKVNNTVEVASLSGITLDAREGDRIGLIGHNGAGKTTLLQVAAGVIQPNQGQVDVGGLLLPLLGHTSGFDFDRNGIDNVMIRGRLLGIPRDVLKEKMPDIIAFSELEEFIYLPLRSYSTGMVMRLSVAMTLIHEPDIIILDEMFNAGDEQFTRKIQDHILSFLDKAKILLLTTHDIAAVEQICNRVVVLSGGRLVYDGGVSEGVEKYRNHSD